MASYRVAEIGGDGIGPDVTREAMKVGDATGEVFGFKLERTVYPFGTEHWLRTQEILPDSALAEIRQHDAVYLGAIGDPRAPVGKIEHGIIMGLRLGLDLYVNLRPVKLYDARLCPLKDKTPAQVDMLIVRENTEDAYTGPHGFTHFGRPGEVATQVMVYTRHGVERCVRYAFELARRRGKQKKVLLIDKANAVRAQDLWTRVFAEVAREYPDIATDHAYIDAACMWLVKNPEWFDVAVTTNLFGDIITDLGAMIQGGMGIAASGNLHPGKVSLFEPIHGSAPKHAGKNVSSPVAAILAMSMLLDYVGEKPAAQAIEGSVVKLFQSGRLRGVSTGDHKTTEVGDMVAAEVRAAARAGARA
jgi:3-isopropylmalate dehydrogenase